VGEEAEVLENENVVSAAQVNFFDPREALQVSIPTASPDLASQFEVSATALEQLGASSESGYFVGVSGLDSSAYEEAFSFSSAAAAKDGGPSRTSHKRKLQASDSGEKASLASAVQRLALSFRRTSSSPLDDSTTLLNSLSEDSFNFTLPLSASAAQDVQSCALSGLCSAELRCTFRTSTAGLFQEFENCDASIVTLFSSPAVLCSCSPLSTGNRPLDLSTSFAKEGRHLTRSNIANEQNDQQPDFADETDTITFSSDFAVVLAVETLNTGPENFQSLKNIRETSPVILALVLTFIIFFSVLSLVAWYLDESDFEFTKQSRMTELIVVGYV